MERLIVNSGMSLCVAIDPTPVEDDEAFMDDDTTVDDCDDEE